MTAKAKPAGEMAGLTDAIEILDMCKPIRDYQGGMWFGRNNNFADATFVDYGACRAFAVAARALPDLVTEASRLWDRIRKLEYDNNAAAARIGRLEADLLECREFIENYSDVVDGDYGASAPNRAMRLVSMIDETLGSRDVPGNQNGKNFPEKGKDFPPLALAEAACLRLCTKHGLATGHGDTVADIIDEISGQIDKRAILAAQQATGSS